ncbi:hypothetical protein AV530_008081 [Patagioenas fasciata monilis]|uniref:Uncharacterized protein n=1 Tax=Patagioenas fasciata monilis TaxID=372326 RepID=A0A1V4KUD9_PATFA|nr:hypothetical protein AV530_008081 [Patagioenas fasciata monilis]
MGAPQATLARAKLRRARSSHIDDMLSFLHAKTTTEEWPDLRVWRKISEQKCLCCFGTSSTLVHSEVGSWHETLLFPEIMKKKVQSLET